VAGPVTLRRRVLTEAFSESACLAFVADYPQDIAAIWYLRET
jgi:hypothetical protein